nr:hypothetical protein [Tanacetum cinerariifolium]
MEGTRSQSLQDLLKYLSSVVGVVYVIVVDVVYVLTESLSSLSRPSQLAGAHSRCWTGFARTGEKLLTKQVNMFMRLFRSDDKFSQMLTQLESQPEYGGGNGSGGCGDDEPGDDEDGGEDEERRTIVRGCGVSIYAIFSVVGVVFVIVVDVVSVLTESLSSLSRPSQLASQALINRKKVIITEHTIRKNLRLDDADGIDFLPNEEIFAELARIGLVRNVDSPSKFLMYPRFLQVMINAQVDDLSSHNTKYTSPALIHKVFANMRRIVQEDEDDNKVSAAPTLPLPKPTTTQPPPQQEPIPSPPQAQFAQLSSPPQQQPSQTADISMTLLNTLLETWRKIAKVDVDEDVTLEDVDAEVEIDANIQRGCQSLMLRKRRGVVIQDPEETTAASIIMHTEVKSKDKGKGILIKEPNPLKRQAQIEQDEVFARQLEAELNANINWNDVLEQVKRREKQDNTVMRYQALKRKLVIEAQARKNMMIYLKNMSRFKMDFFKAKKQRIVKEAYELKTHLQIVANDDDDDVYTEATPLASKVPIVDYQINHENNKPYYKIIKADGTHKLFLSFITLLKNFDKEDLEALWKLVKERFESTEPNNFSNDFLLNTFKIMFEKPNVEANMILLVEKKYHLTHFTLEQMLNNVRLEVEEESEMSLELLRLVRRQLNEGCDLAAKKSTKLVKYGSSGILCVL